MVLKGVIHGKTIELEQSPGLPDGQVVTVSMSPATSPTSAEAFEALQRAAGGWSDDPEGVDRFVEEVRQSRKQSRREIPD